MNQHVIASEEPVTYHLPQVDTSPSAMLRLAIQRGADMAQIEKFMDLRDRHEATEARKAYVAAMAAFKAEPLTISKDKTVSYGTTSYTHASIGNVTTLIAGALGKHGFSHRWDTKQEGDAITVSCVITHELGHSEATVLTASPDKSGQKNAIQSIASTVTYLQRYTLLAATGMATSDQEDDDGRKAEAQAQEPDPILDPLMDKIELSESADQLRSVKAEIAAANLPQEKARKAIGFYNARFRELGSKA